MARGSSVASSGTENKKKGFKLLGKGFSIKKKDKKKQRLDDESLISRDISSSASARRDPPRSVNGASSYQARRPSGGESSFATSSSSGAIAQPIQVVLLLMDPASRRFELLQLEFDSNKAMVSDVLRQIQSSATESTLRDMNYTGVCDRDGMEMISSMKLSKFCKGNDVVMAMPKGMTGNGTAKLAGPILGDPKVGNMLAPVGVQAQPSEKSRSAGSKLTKIAEEDIRRKENKSPPPRTNAGKATKKQSSSSKLPTVILWIIISSLLFGTAKRHVDITRPLEPGQVLLPGQWKSQCGIFDLFPEKWLGELPMNKLSSSCDASSSSVLELGRDGTLRYFTRGDDEERKVMWSFVGGEKECLEEEEEGDEEQCFGSDDTQQGAMFDKDGNDWYVNMGGLRTLLNKDVVRDFTAEN